MVPRALEQYVVQLAQHGPGACAMPKVEFLNLLKNKRFLILILLPGDRADGEGEGGPWQRPRGSGRHGRTRRLRRRHQLAVDSTNIQ